ncbi:MAG TPA: AAA family ATPase [Planctomycetota bacterium]|nr:AAA family ATPase [Planctomycetota bacterium]
MATMDARVDRVRLRNFKSIAACDVRLGRLTVLVGPNGSGKSNFVDALRFVRDALDNTLEWALRHQRGGIQKVRRISRGHPHNFAIALDLGLPGGCRASYAFEIGSRDPGGFVVKREQCQITSAPRLAESSAECFLVESGQLKQSSVKVQVQLEPDRLALVSLSGTSAFRPVFDHLSNMAFYELNPRRMRDLQDPDPGERLKSDGSNIASVIRELARASGGTNLKRINEHLKMVFPDLIDVQHEQVKSKETLQFRQYVQGDQNPWTFDALNMSDGTVRALGVLVALFPPPANGHRQSTLVALEEPEVAIHPGAVRTLGDAFLGASERTQVLLTTHSPDLLDHESLDDTKIRAVRMEAGRTYIGEVDSVTRAALKDQLYSAGELLRQGQIVPDPEATRIEPEQLELFRDEAIG